MKHNRFLWPVLYLALSFFPFSLFAQLGSVELATDYLFKNKKTTFEPGDEIFARFLTDKPLGDVFKDAFQLSSVPMSGTMIVAIGVDENDEDPIVIAQYAFFPNRYTKDNQFAITIQMDEDKLDKLGNELDGKVPFNSAQTLAKGDVKLLWAQAAAKMSTKKHSWTLFFFFKKANSEDMAEAGRAVFNYNVTKENKDKLIGGMNFYDKERFEKLPDDGIKHDLHKNNIGKILFSASPIAAEMNDASKTKTSFASLSPGIFARLYIKESVRNMLATDGKGKDFGGAALSVVFRVNGKLYVVGDGISKEDGLVRTTWGFPLVPNSPGEYNEICKTFLYILSVLPAGKHKIKIEYRMAAGAVALDETAMLGENEIEVNIAAADRDAVVKKYGSTFQGSTIPEADYVALVKKQYPGLGHRFTKMEIYRGPLGQVTHRLSRVSVAYKNQQGDYLVAVYDLKQEFVGGKWAQSIGIERSLGTSYIPPQNIKP